MKTIRTLLLIASAAIATPAFAGPLTVAVTGGTQGVGPEITYQVGPVLSVRGSATWLGVSGDGTVDGYRYHGHAHIANFGGTVDVHPFMNGFRISGGARSVGDDHIYFDGAATTPRTYGGVVFTPDQAGGVTGRISTRSVAPVATVGYTHTFVNRIMIGVDGGVMFHGSPRVEDLAYSGQLGSNPLAAAERDRQAASLSNRVNDYKYYPVAQLSLGYRF